MPILSFLDNVSITLQTALGVCLIYYVTWQLRNRIRRYRMIRKHGCKPVKDSPVYNSWKDSLFGWTQLASNIKAHGQHKLLEHSRDRFLRHGNTLHFKIAFDDLVFTTEPENVKTMLATKFKDWNLPNRRKATLIPLFGKGIFTTDGAAWQHSRDLLRPSFARSQISDLSTLDKHIDHLVQSIPRDGSTVDLQELFFRLTIDSATEFLFGESTNCLAPGASDTVSRFADAFNRSQAAAAQANRSIPILAKLIPNSQNKRDIEYVHSFTDRYVRLGLQWLKQQDFEKSSSKNALRLYPVVPSNTRMAAADTVLPLGGGHDGKSPLFIPAGTSVGWHLYTMQRRTDLYGDDADQFKPERWDTLRPSWEYLPFNGGPRICIGQQFALTEASYTIIRLMQEFKTIDSRDQNPWVEMLTLTCAGQATKVTLTPA